jgi:hypothetical protein
VKQVAERDVAVQSLGREVRCEHGCPRQVQVVAKRRDRSALRSVGRPELGKQALDVVTNVSQPAQLTPECPQRIMQFPQDPTEPARVLRVRAKLILWSRLDLGNPLGERHPEAVVAVRARRDQPAQGHRQAGRCQELEYRDLALKPCLRVVVKRNRSGHDARDDRRGAKVHEHVAVRMDHDRLVHLHPGGSRDGVRGRESTLLESARHSGQSRTAEADGARIWLCGRRSACVSPNPIRVTVEHRPVVHRQDDSFGVVSDAL